MRVSIATRLNPRGIVWVVAIAYGLAWLLDLPIVLSKQGLASPWVALLTLQNFTPAIATVLVARWISPVPRLRWGAKGSRWAGTGSSGWWV